MKTKIITVQGTDFAVTGPAEALLLKHLKDVQAATRFRPAAYKENIEALRDVLIEQGGKNISLTKMAAAVALVGVPDRKVLKESVKARFPRLHTAAIKALRPLRRLQSVIVQHWWKSIAVVFAAAAIVMSAGSIFSLLMMLQSSTDTKSGWDIINTSIGPVRSFHLAHSINQGWFTEWGVHALNAVLFMAIALLVLRLRRPKRLPFILALLGCVFMLQSLWITQQQTMKQEIAAGAYWSTDAEPLQPHMAYLQECGDEIQYVFDGGTDGMLFRQLRDEGFQLAGVIPTRESDGTIDTKTLCRQYDTLRRDHAKANIVLQYYAKNEDGTIRPYEFSDLGEGISSYGLFVKA